MFAFFIVAFVFGIVASIIAYSKGRNSLGWFLVGLAIGPFSLVVSLLPPIPRHGYYVKCPTCAEVVKADAHLCRFCHTSLYKAVQ